MKIIDELTGRILEGRRFGDGLHQALEAKEEFTLKLKIKHWHQLLIKIILSFIKKFLVVPVLL